MPSALTFTTIRSGSNPTAELLLLVLLLLLLLLVLLLVLVLRLVLTPPLPLPLLLLLLPSVQWAAPSSSSTIPGTALSPSLAARATARGVPHTPGANAWLRAASREAISR